MNNTVKNDFFWISLGKVVQYTGKVVKCTSRWTFFWDIVYIHSCILWSFIDKRGIILSTTKLSNVRMSSVVN